MLPDYHHIPTWTPQRRVQADELLRSSLLSSGVEPATARYATEDDIANGQPLVLVASNAQANRTFRLHPARSRPPNFQASRNWLDRTSRLAGFANAVADLRNTASYVRERVDTILVLGLEMYTIPQYEINSLPAIVIEKLLELRAEAYTPTGEEPHETVPRPRVRFLLADLIPPGAFNPAVTGMGPWLNLLRQRPHFAAGMGSLLDSLLQQFNLPIGGNQIDAACGLRCLDAIDNQHMVIILGRKNPYRHIIGDLLWEKGVRPRVIVCSPLHAICDDPQRDSSSDALWAFIQVNRYTKHDWFHTGYANNPQKLAIYVASVWT